MGEKGLWQSFKNSISGPSARLFDHATLTTAAVTALATEAVYVGTGNRLPEISDFGLQFLRPFVDSREAILALTLSFVVGNGIKHMASAHAELTADALARKLRETQFKN